MDTANRLKRLVFSFIFISAAIFIFRPFIVRQIVLRGDGYLGYTMYNDAVRQYKKALVLDPENNNIRSWLGYAYKSSGDKTRAVEIYEDMLKINPQDIIACHDLGMIYAADRKFQLAKEYFSKAASVAGSPEDDTYTGYHGRSLDMLAICQERLGEIEEAIKTSEKTLEYYPGSKLAEGRIKRLRKKPEVTDE